MRDGWRSWRATAFAVAVPLVFACSETDDTGGSAGSAGIGGASGAAGAGGGAAGDAGSAGGAAGAAGSAGGAAGAGSPDCSVGAPVQAPDGQWTVVMSPGTACGNAGQAGFVINPSSASKSLVIYLSGGGACFNKSDCAATLLAGFSETEAKELAQGRALFNRSNAQNPFADWDFVFVPYCTGDFHTGGKVASYGTSHVGHANLEQHLKRIIPTFCDADRVVVTGTSAGGFGATFSYARIHELYGSISVDLISDSGPYMTPDYMPLAMQDMIDENWGFRANMPSDCSECQSGWHALYAYVAGRWPNDRMSFISYTRDPSIQGRFSKYAPLDDLVIYEQALDALADDVLVPLPNFRVFYLDAQGHVLLNGANPLSKSQNGVTLGTFMKQQLDDDPAWADVRP